MGQGRRLARQCIQQYRSFQLVIVVIGKLEQKRGKAEAIEIDAAAHLQHFRTIAIRQKSRNIVTLKFIITLPLFFHPVIIVLHNHQDIALRKLFLPIQHHIADALIEDVCTLVAAGHHDGIIQTYTVITVG